MYPGVTNTFSITELPGLPASPTDLVSLLKVTWFAVDCEGESFPLVINDEAIASGIAVHTPPVFNYTSCLNSDKSLSIVLSANVSLPRSGFAFTISRNLTVVTPEMIESFFQV